MADPVAPLMVWRRPREIVVHETVKHNACAVSAEEVAALSMRIERLERIISALAKEAALAKC